MYSKKFLKTIKEAISSDAADFLYSKGTQRTLKGHLKIRRVLEGYSEGTSRAL